MSRTHSNSDPEKLLAFAVEAARLLHDRKCTEVVLLDVRGHSQVSDYVAIGSGTSQRQMRSVAQEIEDLGASMGFPPFRSSRDQCTTWIVVDCVDVVVHLFEPDQRLYYDLELMYANASRVEWRRPAGTTPKGGAATAKSSPVEEIEAPADSLAAGPAKSSAKSSAKSPAKSSAQPSAKTSAKNSKAPRRSTRRASESD